MSSTTATRTLLALLILALLLAQGMRVCMHAYGDPDHVATHAHDVSSTHIESTLDIFDGHDEALSDTHVTLVWMLKHLAAEPLMVALLIALLFILKPQATTLWRTSLRKRIFPSSYGHYFSPPLRAPPH